VFSSVFGTLAMITSFIGVMPQIYKAFQTKSTQDVSMLMLLNYLLCSFSWLVYGLQNDLGFVISSNVVGTVVCLVSVLQKWYYDSKIPRIA